MVVVVVVVVVWVVIALICDRCPIRIPSPQWRQVITDFPLLFLFITKTFTTNAIVIKNTSKTMMTMIANIIITLPERTFFLSL